MLRPRNWLTKLRLSSRQVFEKNDGNMLTLPGLQAGHGTSTLILQKFIHKLIKYLGQATEKGRKGEEIYFHQICKVVVI